MRRAALLALAVACAAGAWVLADRDGIGRGPLIDAWRAQFPDERELGAADRAAFETQLAAARHEDLLLLAAGLAAGCLALACFPRLAREVAEPVPPRALPAEPPTATPPTRPPRRAGSAAAAVLVCGSVALGVAQLALSVREQARSARAGRWTVGDDVLGAMVGSLEPTLRAWRETVPEDHAVLLVGTNQRLWNVTAWALYPRPLYPVLHDVPPELDADALRAMARQLPAGRDHPGRWLVDLGALARDPGGAGALVRVDP